MQLSNEKTKNKKKQSSKFSFLCLITLTHYIYQIILAGLVPPQKIKIGQEKPLLITLKKITTYIMLKTSNYKKVRELFPPDP